MGVRLSVYKWLQRSVVTGSMNTRGLFVINRSFTLSRGYETTLTSPRTWTHEDNPQSVKLTRENPVCVSFPCNCRDVVVRVVED